MSNQTQNSIYKNEAPSGAYSNSIWYDCEVNRLRDGSLRGCLLESDFLTKPTTDPTTAADYGSYVGFSSAGGAFTDVSDSTAGLFGALKMSPTTTADLSISLRTLVTPFRISKLANVGKFWGEARLCIPSAAATAGSCCVGLMDAGTLIVGLPLTTGDVIITTQNFLGFLKIGSAATWKAMYQANGVAPVGINGTTQTTVTGTTAVATSVADTYLNLGMKYDHQADVLTYFVDGIPVATHTVGSATAGTDFPDDVQMGPIIGWMNGALAAAAGCTIDKWRWAQLAP
jgi:hypothetical protein